MEMKNVSKQIMNCSSSGDGKPEYEPSKGDPEIPAPRQPNPELPDVGDPPHLTPPLRDPPPSTPEPTPAQQPPVTIGEKKWDRLSACGCCLDRLDAYPTRTGRLFVELLLSQVRTQQGNRTTNRTFYRTKRQLESYGNLLMA